MALPLIPLMLATTGISTLGKFIANRQAAKVARQNTNLTIAENKKQAELAYQREQQQISEMNKYNSPQSQMERFKEARLNPNLIYNQGTPGNQTQFAKYNAPRLEYNYIPKFKGDEFESIKQLPLAYAQVKNSLAVGKTNEAKAKMEEAISIYASEIASSKFYSVINQQAKDELEYIIGKSKLFGMTETVKTSEGDLYRVKPEYMEVIIQDVINKYKMSTTELGKSQTDVQIKNQLLKNLGVVPFLQPLIQFLKLFN